MKEFAAAPIARVYPETPAYDLVARFLEPQMNAPGPIITPIVIPTDPGVVPAETTTRLPTDMATLTSTNTAYASIPGRLSVNEGGFTRHAAYFLSDQNR